MEFTSPQNSREGSLYCSLWWEGEEVQGVCSVKLNCLVSLDEVIWTAAIYTESIRACSCMPPRCGLICKAALSWLQLTVNNSPEESRPLPIPGCF